eukprot:14063014-Alexandrium_andersonii.AAC.1
MGRAAASPERRGWAAAHPGSGKAPGQPEPHLRASWPCPWPPGVPAAPEPNHWPPGPPRSAWHRRCERACGPHDGR